MEILILHPGGLGDILLSLPAIALLRKGYPSARLTIAGNIDHLAAVGRGYADHIISLSTLPLHYLHAPGKVPEAEARFWRSFDHIVSWTGSGDPEFVRKLKQIRPSACVAAWRPGPHETRHVSRLFIESLGHEIDSGIETPQTEISLDPNARDQGAQWLSGHGWNGRDRLMALHPGAGSRLKRWPLSRFIELARRLVLHENTRLLIIEGPADSGLAMQMAAALAGMQAITVPLSEAVVRRMPVVSPIK